jgi:FAD/FMN-containing dehydrogenase
MTALSYENRKQQLVDFLQNHNGQIRLGKETSNLFRERNVSQAPKLDVRQFKNVLNINHEENYVEVEGMTPYSTLVDACLKEGVMPTVVPQLKSITIGGATTGCGIESSSYKHGLVHEGVKEIEVLLADGSTVLATPDNEHKDLFFGFPNSYGTLGYALKLKVKTIPVKPFVHIQHIKFTDAAKFFEAMNTACDLTNGNENDFVDGSIFSENEMYLTTGKFVEKAPYTSDYTYKNIYFKSIQEREEDYLSTHDYIWRWDTDWFWCSKNMLAQNPLIRRLYGKKRLNSVFYTKIMRWDSKWGLMSLINSILDLHTESVIQDVEVSIDKAPDFFKFYFENIKFTPVWVCPIKPVSKELKFDLYQMEADKLYVNYGFWDVISTREPYPEGHFNKLIEQRVQELGGNKSLYSDSYYSKTTFWQIYDQSAYEALKRKYDPEHILKDLYTKCVLNG